MKKEKINDLIKLFDLKRLPIENTYYKRTYLSDNFINNNHASSCMIGLYSKDLDSHSCFHKLSVDETWHFYDGDPIVLYLLDEDGSTNEVILGNDYFNNQLPQYTIKANIWQAATLLGNGHYALYGCSVTPAFYPKCFTAAIASELIKKYPQYEGIILSLNKNITNTKLPEDIDN